MVSMLNFMRYDPTNSALQKGHTLFDNTATSTQTFTLGQFLSKFPSLTTSSSEFWLDFNPPIELISPPIAFNPTLRPTLVVRLSDFKDSYGKPAGWFHRIRPTSTQTVRTDIAEVHIPLVADDDCATFVPNGHKRQPLQWKVKNPVTNTEDKQEILRPTFAMVAFRWIMVPSRHLRPLVRFTPKRRSARPRPPLIKVSFRIDDLAWGTKQLGWQCPLCQRFGPFRDQFFLQCHLEKDHPRIEPVIFDEVSAIRWNLLYC